MTMGMTEHDLAAARARLGDGAWQQRVLEQLAAVARPPRKISVQPFLCSRGVLEEVPGELVDVGEDFDLAWPAQAKAFASKLGMRLISEAELEWLARNGEQAPFSLGAEDHHGGQSRFGIRDAFLGVWAADDWHPNYDGAPSDSNPWLAGDPEGVYRGGVLPAAIQSDEEWPHVMSAARYHGAEPSDYYGVRLSLDL